MKTTELSHFFWKEWIRPGNTIIDATCGNGHDLLYLAQLIDGQGHIVGYDIQAKAIESTTELLKQNLTTDQWNSIKLRHASHEYFFEKKADAIIYNLGYLPGSDKKITTQTATTLKSLQSACALIQKSGFISVMLYPGHIEGEKEQIAILEFASTLPACDWSILHHRWINREKAPSLLLMLREEVPSYKKCRIPPTLPHDQKPAYAL